MSASPRTLLLLVFLSASALFGSATSALAQSQNDPASLWADFNHYTLVARPDLAKAAGQTLLQQVDEQKLLDLVEASDYADRYQDILAQAERIKSLKSVAQKLDDEIQAARVSRARDPKRIASNIALLDQGERAYRNAVARLKGAGQYAAPQLLATLEDGSKAELHPYVIEAMNAIGKPLVPALSEALPHLQAPVMIAVAQVLANAGYPQALPALKQVSESKKTDPHARTLVAAAYKQLLAASSPSFVGMSSADLYVALGHSDYHKETIGQQPIGYDNSKHKGIVWYYNADTGLVSAAVPSPIFGDVLAMRAAKRALELSPNMDPALSLWLMANLRRADRLPAGEKDPTYGQDMRQPAFYAMLAGPERLQDVLTQALVDDDADLALDAIDALEKTAGTEALIHKNAGRRPLLEALSYPDVRVRFRAAVALAKARPNEAFTGVDRVVPVLGEAVRANGAKYALILANSQQRRNDLAAWTHALGYQTVTGNSLVNVSDDIAQLPGVDLIVVDQPIAQIKQLYGQTIRNYKLASVPILSLTSAGDQIRLESMFGQNKRMHSAVAADKSAFDNAVKAAMSDYAGTSLNKAQSTQFALTALAALRDIAWSSGVYDATDAESQVIKAVADSRTNVAEAAAGVLALIKNADAQQAIANEALNASGARQVAMLNALADSATHFGNMLTTKQADAITKLVESAQGDLAVAAAQAHGALTLPTSSAVQMILTK